MSGGGGGGQIYVHTCTLTERMAAKLCSFIDGSSLELTSALPWDTERSLETAARILEAGMEAGILVEAGLAVVSSDVS